MRAAALRHGAPLVLEGVKTAPDTVGQIRQVLGAAVAQQRFVIGGSEIKAVLTWPGLARTGNLTAIDHYLSLQYVPAPETAFAGIYRVPAAHYLVVSPDSEGRWRDRELTRYWRLPAPGRKPR